MKILLPIDDSACSEAAVQAVITQFRPESDVRVLYVDEWPKGLPISMAFAEGPAAASSILYTHNEARQRGNDLIAGVAQRLVAAKFHATTEMREGDARHEILDCAADWKPDVIVLGSHGRRGLDRVVFGSVAEGVISDAPCSVEVVRASAS
jgi:nucleotide-binding universal stress UspA family protein